MHHPTDRITHTTVFVTPVVEHCMEREIAQWGHQERTFLPRRNSSIQEGMKEMFYLTTHSTHFIYGYMASDIW